MEHDMLRRFGCALCALAFALTALPTAAFAQQPEEQAAVQQSLSATDVREMQQADAAVTVLTESEQYQEMDTEARKDAALAQLDTLAAKGLVEKDSIYTDEENGMVSFRYPCGVLGGILLTEPEDETLDEENAETETTSNALPLRLPPHPTWAAWACIKPLKNARGCGASRIPFLSPAFAPGFSGLGSVAFCGGIWYNEHSKTGTNDSKKYFSGRI